MSQIFISHSTKDKAIAVGILDHLRAAGYSDDQLFLDDDEQSGILAGLRWETQLFSSLENCACLVVVATQNWCDSKWCFAEALVAKNLDRKIIPLLVELDAEQNTLIKEFQAIRDFSLTAAKLHELSTSLERLTLRPDTESEGWKLTSATPELREQIAKKVLAAMPWWWNLTQLLVVAIFAIVLTFSIAATTYTFREPIKKYLFPPALVTLTVDEFVEAVRDPSERDAVVTKKVESLSGVPLADYSAAKPRILIENDVEVNINGMQGGDPIPQTLPENVTFSCVVESVNPLTVGGQTLKVTVYVTEFQILDPSSE